MPLPDEDLKSIFGMSQPAQNVGSLTPVNVGSEQPLMMEDFTPPDPSIFDDVRDTLGRQLQNLGTHGLDFVGRTLQGADALEESFRRHLDDKGFGKDDILFGSEGLIGEYVHKAVDWLGDTSRGLGNRAVNVADTYRIPEPTIAEEIIGSLGEMGLQAGALVLGGPTAGSALFTLQGAQQMEEKLKESGLDDTPDGDTALLLGAPATAIVEKAGLDRIMKMLPPEGKARVLGYLKQALQAGGIEMLEERAEDLLQDLSIKMFADSSYDLSALDPSLKREDIVAGGAGASFRTIMNLLLPKRYQVPPQQLAPQTGVEMASKKEEGSTGFVGPLIDTELLKARQAQDAAEERLKEKTRGVVEQDFLNDLDFGKQLSPGPGSFPLDRIGKEFEDTVRAIKVRKDDGTYVDGIDFLKEGAAKPGRVYLAETAGRDLYSMKIQATTDIMNRAELPETKARFAKILEQYKAAQRNYFQWKTEAAQVMESWLKLVDPQGTIVLSDTNESENIFGQATRHKDVGFILINPKILEQQLGKDPKDVGPKLDKNHLYSTLAHEFGHIIVDKEYRKASRGVQIALTNEYKEWFKKRQQSKNELEYIAHHDTPTQIKGGRYSEAHMMGQPLEVKNDVNMPLRHSWETYEYQNSLAEYFAQQFTRYAESTEEIRGPAAPFWKKVINKLRKFYQKARVFHRPQTTFAAWMDSIMKRTAVQANETRVRENPETIQTPAGLEKAYVNPTNYDPTKVEAAQEQQIKEEVEDYIQVHGTKDERPALRDQMNKAEIPYDGEVIDRLDGKRDNFSRFKSLTLTLLQIARRNKHIPGLDRPTSLNQPGYVQLNRMLQNANNKRIREVDGYVKDWWGLSSQGGERVGRLLAEADRISFRRQRKLTDNEIYAMAKEIGLNDNEFEVYKKIRGSLESALNQIEEALVQRAGRLSSDPQVVAAEVAQIRDSVTKLRNRNYFPSTRFGNNAVILTATEDNTEFENQTYNKGDTILREHYETAGDATARAAALKRLNIGRVALDRVPDSRRLSLEGLPRPVLELIRDTLPLEAQKDLQRALVESAPGRGFVKHLLRKKGVAGASQDYMKNYVSYMQSLTRYIGKINFEDRMDHAIDDIDATIPSILATGGDARKRRMIVDHLRDHRNYLFNPGNEFDEWSALAFNYYLAGVPKQAVLNMLQIPTVVVPYLTSKYGNVTAVANMLYAQKVVFQRKFRPEKLPPDLQEAIKQGEEDGVLDQSYAHEVAALTNARNLDRLMPGKLLGSQKIAKLNSQVAELGSWLFHKSEMFARRMAFVAAWKSEYDKSGDNLRAYQAGRDAVQMSAFEYARYNRPRIMQGKTRPLFIFQTHVQHYLEYLFGDNPGKWKAWATLLAIAGIQGLPFIEDFEDILDWAIARENKITGNYSRAPTTKESLRKEIYELVELTGTDSPAMITDLILHGGSRYSFGLSWLAEKAQIPFPNTDLSASLSLGDIIPGTQALKASDTDQALAQATEGILGPGFGIPLNIMKAVSDTGADLDKRIQRAAPRFVANPLKALDYYDRGYVNKQGIKKVDFDRNNPYHQGEMIAQALGFTPTRVSVEQDKSWAQMQTDIYYSTQKRMLARQLALAAEAQSQEAIADVRKAIVKFNDTVPYPSYKINSNRILQGVVQSLKNRKLISMGYPTSIKEIPVYVDIEKLYEDLEKEVKVEIVD